MKNHTLPLVVMAILSLWFASCTNKRVEYFKLSIVITQDFGFNEGEPLNGGIRSLCNYYTDTSCVDRVYIPEISIVRADFVPEKIGPLSVPLSSLNSWRKSLNLLSATNLIEDYDEHIPNLTTPQILATKSNASANIDATIQKYPSARLVTVNDSIMFQIANLRDEICKRLCNNSTAISAIILYRSVGSTKSSFVPEIDAENVRIEKTKSQEQRGLMVVQTVEKYKPRIGDDPFALYALSKTIIYGQEHHEAFELLSEAAEFAIKQGKAAELYQRISDDIEKDLLRKDIRDRTIWRLSTPDHKKHWLPIVTALTRNDAKLLGHD